MSLDVAAGRPGARDERRPVTGGGAGEAGERRLVDGWALLLLPAVILLLVVFIYPLATIASRSFTTPRLGIQNYQDFFTQAAFRRVLLTTVQVSVVVTVVCLLIGYPYAYLMASVGRTWRTVLLFLVLLPFWTNLLVRTFALILLLNDTGLINTYLRKLGLISGSLPLIRNNIGVMIGMTQILLPYMVLPLYATMVGIDRSLLRAANNLGAGPLTAFRKVFLPLSKPGIVAGSLLVFVLALGFYITPALLGGPQNIMLGQLIAQQISQVLNWGLGGAAAMILLVVTLIVLAVVSRFIRLQREILRIQ
jgi:putative spermidine/putrescine transport system permease protein